MSAQPRKRKDNLQNLRGRVALVTAASRGAGRAVAAVLGEHGATVYVPVAACAGGQAPITCLEPSKTRGERE